jgi:hypothetical protein
LEKKQPNGELHNLYPLPNIIRVIKSRKLRWAGGEEECIQDIDEKGKRNGTTRMTMYMGG